MINMSDRLEEEIKKELVRLMILKENGKASAYTIGAINAFNRVLKISEDLDDMDICQMNRLYFRTMRDSVFEEDYEGR